MHTLVIVGGGFAGFWAAVSASRQAQSLGTHNRLRIVVVAPNTHLEIRPRFYESDPCAGRVPIANILSPLGIRRIQDHVTAIDHRHRTVTLGESGKFLPYDALVLAAGSRLKGRDNPSMAQAFNVDSLESSRALQRHLANLAARGWATPAAQRVVVVGAGLTGLEMATALPGRLRAMGLRQPRVHLVDSADIPGEDYSPEAREYIHHRLEALDIQRHPRTRLTEVLPDRVVMHDGRILESATAILCTGMQASPLTAFLPGTRSPDGRLEVAGDLSLPEAGEVFVAGDAALAMADAGHPAPMSCQHALPQGRIAGHNTVNHIFGRPTVSYRQRDYVTCVDLGGETALFTRGWERRVALTGAEAKALKTRIVTEWIMPPSDPEACLAASLPEMLRDPTRERPKASLAHPA